MEQVTRGIGTKAVMAHLSTTEEPPETPVGEGEMENEEEEEEIPKKIHELPSKNL